MSIEQDVLKLLETDARQPSSLMARQLNISEEQVESAIRKLEADRVILAFKPLVDAEKAGRSKVEAVIDVRITPEREGGFNRIAARIARFDEVRSCVLMSGDYDLQLQVEGDDLKDIARFVSERLSSIPGVLSTASHFMLKTYKANGVMFAEDSESDRLKVSP